MKIIHEGNGALRLTSDKEDRKQDAEQDALFHLDFSFSAANVLKLFGDNERDSG